MHKKTIAIIAPAVVPLPIKIDAPKFISINDVSYPLKAQCSASSTEGDRALLMAEQLSELSDYEVILFVPDLHFPGLENIDVSSLKFSIKKYNYKNTIHTWSEELDRKLKQCDFVIVQTKSNVAWLNCAVLPKTVNVIVDGYESPLLTMPATLLNQHKIKRTNIWKNILSNYNDLLLRSNCVLYDNDRQKSFYEGHFFAIGKLSWRAFKFAPLLQLSYSINRKSSVVRNTKTESLKYLFFDYLYPWYNYPELLKFFETSSMELDLLGYPPAFYKVDIESVNYYINNTDNIRMVPDSSSVNLKDYDGVICFSHNWLDEYYIPRYQAIRALAQNVPVLINDNSALFADLPEKSHHIFPIHSVADINAITKSDLYYYETLADKENTKSDIVYRARDLDQYTELKHYIRMFSDKESAHE